MRSVWRIVVADLWWLLSGWRGILLLVALPAMILFLVGNLRSHVEEYRVGIAGSPLPGSQTHQLEEGIQLWHQLSGIRVVRINAPAKYPIVVLRDQNLDLLLNVGDTGPECWRMYSGETTPARAIVLHQVAASLERSLWLIAARRKEDSAILCGSEESATDTRESASAALVGLEAALPSLLWAYYPAASNRRTGMFPMTIAFVVCFLPFVFAVSSLIRAKESRTLEVVLSAPGVHAGSLFWARALLPAALGAFLFLMMVVQVDALFGLHTKGGMVTTLPAIIPALLVASFLGVAASALVSSQTQAVMSSALYFAALMLLTGFIAPLTGASPVVVALSRLLPLTFVMPALNAWFYGAPLDLVGSGWLAFQLVASLALGWLSFRRFLRRL